MVEFNSMWSAYNCGVWLDSSLNSSPRHTFGHMDSSLCHSLRISFQVWETFHILLLSYAFFAVWTCRPARVAGEQDVGNSLSHRGTYTCKTIPLHKNILQFDLNSTYEPIFMNVHSHRRSHIIFYTVLISYYVEPYAQQAYTIMQTSTAPVFLVLANRKWHKNIFWKKYGVTQFQNWKYCAND